MELRHREALKDANQHSCPTYKYLVRHSGNHTILPGHDTRSLGALAVQTRPEMYPSSTPSSPISKTVLPMPRRMPRPQEENVWLSGVGRWYADDDLPSVNGKKKAKEPMRRLFNATAALEVAVFSRRGLRTGRRSVRDSPSLHITSQSRRACDVPVRENRPVWGVAVPANASQFLGTQAAN